MKLIMNRNGEFRCKWSSANGKCGADPVTAATYFYSCEIEASPTLDRNDFLLDQLDIDRYFQGRYPIDHQPRSCERIALNAVNDILRIIGTHMAAEHGASATDVIYRLKVSIGFDSRAVMTAEWTRPRGKR